MDVVSLRCRAEISFNGFPARVGVGPVTRSPVLPWPHDGAWRELIHQGACPEEQLRAQTFLIEFHGFAAVPVKRGSGLPHHPAPTPGREAARFPAQIRRVRSTVPAAQTDRRYK